jgi:predicted amidohydrolase
VKVAAYQAPLLPSGSMDALDLIRKRLNRCEAEGVEILCCPEAVLGGLADYAPRAQDIALDVESGQLAALLKPIASDTVTTIIGFTELSGTGQLYNSAAVFHKGAVNSVYRKLHPAIRKSIYQAGNRMPVFTVGSLTFGIIICNDSNFSEPARIMASQGATTLFVPTNNGLPPERPDVVAAARNADIALAVDNRVTVIRADVAGRTADLVSYGSSGIVDRNGNVLQTGQRLEEDLLVANLDTNARER